MNRLILAFALLLPAAGAAEAQSVFPATLACDASGPGEPRERSSFELRLGADGRANYSVRIGKRTETGSGLLAGSRLSLTGASPGGEGHSAYYSGEIGGRGGVLTGTRTATGSGRRRACQVILGDG